MASYTAIHLAERPIDNIVPGRTFTAKQHTIPDAASLQDGEVLLKTLYLSLDPAMRGWLRDRRSYLPPVQIGEVMRGTGVGQIVASKAKDFPVGSYATGNCGWSEYAVLSANKPEQSLQSLSLPEGAVPTDALGALGLTALTAYFGILDVGQVKKGDFVVVSAAAGATGSIAGQIAKIQGARVLGLAGGADKVRWLKEELGFDDALDYKNPDFKKKFREATKDLIDVYFDNVGGEILDMALAQAKPFARFVQCGAISEYNKEKAEGIKNYTTIISMRIRMQGFIVFDFLERYGEARKQLAQWLSEGKLKRKETVVKGGLSQAESALLGLFKGQNMGKYNSDIGIVKTLMVE
jgi:NADPH-dependent curcumin reductase CurA